MEPMKGLIIDITIECDPIILVFGFLNLNYGNNKNLFWVCCGKILPLVLNIPFIFPQVENENSNLNQSIGFLKRCFF